MDEQSTQTEVFIVAPLGNSQDETAKLFEKVTQTQVVEESKLEVDPPAQQHIPVSDQTTNTAAAADQGENQELTYEALARKKADLILGGLDELKPTCMKVVEEALEMFHPFNSEDPLMQISVNLKCQKNDEMKHHGLGYLGYESNNNLRFDGPCIMENGKLIEALLFVNEYRTIHFLFDKDHRPYISTNYNRAQNSFFEVERLVRYSGEVRDGKAHGLGKTFFSPEGWF